MKRLILIAFVLYGCEKEPYCIRCEKGFIVHDFCDGEVDATVVTYNLVNQGYLCERY